MSDAAPEIIRAEVKFTTGRTVPLPSREREALASRERGGVGILAALFWCGEREADGRWLIVDVSTLPPAGSIGLEYLLRAAHGQSWMDALRNTIDEAWPGFLVGYLEEVLQGHDALTAVLSARHRDRLLGQRLPRQSVLKFEHREAVEQLLSTLGENVAGLVLQDLFAYLLGYIGYHFVFVNPVGAPDVVASRQSDELSSDDFRKLADYARRAGDETLARRVEREWRPAGGVSET